MEKILSLTWLNLLQLFKDRSGLAMAIVLPLMLTFLFGTMMGGGERKTTVAVADLDGTAYSKQVVDGLDERSYSLSRTDEESARAMASSGQAAAAVIVPKGFGDDLLGGVDTNVTVVKDPRSNAALAIVEALGGRIQRIAANARTIRIVQGAFRDAEQMTGLPQPPPAPKDVFLYADQRWSPDPPVSVKAVSVTASKVRGAATQAAGFEQYSMGFTLVFMLFMGLGSAGGFLEEREHGTLARLLTTPTSKTLLVTGKVAGIYATVAFQATVMIGAGVAFFRVPWGEDPLAVVMLMGSFALAVTGLGVMISTIVRSRGQMSAVTAIFSTALAMLGGAYWPLDIVNPTMRTIALVTPVGWAMTGLTNVVVRYQGVTQAFLPSLVMLGMGAAFLAVGVSRLKLE